MPRAALLSFAFAAVAAAIALAHERDPVLIYNGSSSAPVGFYVRNHDGPAIGDWVTLPPPPSVRTYATARGFSDGSDRFLKRVAAVTGATVCASGETIFIDGRQVATRRVHDYRQARLPRWDGCQVLGPNEVFLLGLGEDSFDGRYWGVTSVDEIDGVWRLL